MKILSRRRVVMGVLALLAAALVVADVEAGGDEPPASTRNDYKWSPSWWCFTPLEGRVCL